jgi:hypothetical protein
MLLPSPLNGESKESSPLAASASLLGFAPIVPRKFLDLVHLQPNLLL